MFRKLSILLGVIILISTAELSASIKKSKNEIKCLSDMIYHEARGESKKGQSAVAVVTINRAKSGRYPKNLCDVIYQKGQYTWTKRNVEIKDKSLYNDILKLGEKLYIDYHLNDDLPDNLEILDSAMFFSSRGFNRKHFKLITNIGKHKFYSLAKR